MKKKYQIRLDDKPPPLCLKNYCRKLKGHKGTCNRYPMEPLENLPKEIVKKIDKTSMTRGAQPYERVPFENRVRRWNRAVVPYAFKGSKPVGGYENGYVVMVRPEEYFDPETKEKKEGFPGDIIIGQNAFIYYDNRKDWNDYPPEKYGWEPCRITLDGKEVSKRKAGVVDEGHYLVRVPATTTPGPEGERIVKGIPQGIRFFEYASQEETWKTIMQLAYLAWKTVDIENYSTGSIPSHLVSVIQNDNLANTTKFEAIGAMKNGKTSCPLCLEPVRALDLIERVTQAAGREVVDLTITKANLFHWDSLVPGRFNHQVYKVAWGHYHCNIVARDMGVKQTLDWMEKVLSNAGRINHP